MEHHHVGSGAQAATLCNKRGAPVLKHRPLVLGLCLSLHWMQPSISLLFLSSFCLCLATELVLEASKHLQKLCLPASSIYLYFNFTFMFQSHRSASTGRAPGSCSTHVDLTLAAGSGWRLLSTANRLSIARLVILLFASRSTRSACCGRSAFVKPAFAV